MLTIVNIRSGQLTGWCARIGKVIALDAESVGLKCCVKSLDCRSHFPAKGGPNAENISSYF